MEQIRPRNNLDHFGPSNHRLRKMIMTAAMVLAVLILIAVAIYAGAFLMLAPMMQ